MPRYEHDCEHCRFVASDVIDGHAVDLYIPCEQNTITGSILKSGIIRYSSELSDYGCMPLSVPHYREIFAKHGEREEASMR